MRAQTTLDFTIGVAIFIAVLLFAFSFVPGILEPFELGDDEYPKQSDRIADSLAQEKLGSPESPYVLDRYCTVAFFDDDEDPPPGCNFSEESLNDIFNLDSFQNLNVTLEGNATADVDGSDQLCWSGDEVVERSHSDCDENGDGIALTTGDDAPVGTDATITARRVVSLDSNSVRLTVVLW